MGDGHHLWVLGVVRGTGSLSLGWVVDRRQWGLFAWSGCRSQVVGFIHMVGLFVPAGLSFVGMVVTCRVLGGHC